MTLFILSSLVFLFLFILVQNIIYKSIVKKALKKYIELKLIEKGYSFIKYTWPGLFSSGDFKDLEISLITSKYGNSSSDFYANIYYNAGKDNRKVTAKIETSFFSINKVSYSSDL